MKYTFYSMLIFAVFCGIPAFVQQEGRTHLFAETISTAWRHPKLEKRAVEGARILRDIYEATPEQHLRFDSVVASRDGDVCYFMQTWDARQSPDLVYAFFDHDSDRVRYGLEFREIAGQCDGPGSRDLSALAQ
jgi:hypothetical protein